jgi:hypothetical protein
MSARAAANEASAIGTTRVATSGQSAFAATCGAGFYAVDRAHLMTAGFASADFVLPVKHGFALDMGVGDTGVLGELDCNGDATVTDYYFSAAPTSPRLGRRAFATNEAAAIWGVLSTYETKLGVKLYVITEHDRSYTTLLLPEEY